MRIHTLGNISKECTEKGNAKKQTIKTIRWRFKSVDIPTRIDIPTINTFD